MYKSLEAALLDLEKKGQLVRIKEEVDPYLEMAAIQLRLYASKGPAVLFENVKGTNYRCASNIFGSLQRSHFLFRDTLRDVQKMLALRGDPIKALKQPFKNLSAGRVAWHALPKKTASAKESFKEISIHELPQIHTWPQDGGAFITLPQVYTENPDKQNIMQSNIGMYRIQLSGNDYTRDKEIGLHYQIQRGIGIHQTLAKRNNQPLKVSIFIGGPPAHTLAAVMPLPEGISEALFAGMLGGRRFRYFYADGYCFSADADFVITGEVHHDNLKCEGPFGDHLGYYSLGHDFPVMKVHKVYAKDKAIWPFTVVGRPPQEDTSFGELIHEITGNAISQEVPGLQEVNAVDAAGVHPLLLAIGKERYWPFDKTKEPLELLTLANRILGTGQLSLAKYLFLTARDQKEVNTKDIPGFFQYMLERVNLETDLHFYTETTIDTLDYSGTRLNHGSKVAMVVYRDKQRELAMQLPEYYQDKEAFKTALLALPGIIVLQMEDFTNYDAATEEMERISNFLKRKNNIMQTPLIVVCDDPNFTAENINNFVWVTFTRSNPSHDIYGVDSYMHHKHFACKGPLIIDARLKPHHAPVLQEDEIMKKKIDRLWQKGGSLYGH